MAGPSEVRQPAVAGSFYPADPTQCRALARAYTSASSPEESTRRWLGGVVPHAGWICSGEIAGQSIAAIARAGAVPHVVVLFGAIHTPIPTSAAVLDSYLSWNLPDGDCVVQQELRRRLVALSDLFVVDDRFHWREHAIEVELPLVRSVWPQATFLPIAVPPTDRAAEMGRETARAIAAIDPSAVFLASSDLTHYGPAYNFAPAGVGVRSLDWARQNDLSLIERILKLQEESIVPDVRAQANACGPGAIAAMIAACKEFGASETRLLRHANSYETLAAVAPQSPDNAVGYASIVVG